MIYTVLSSLGHHSVRIYSAVSIRQFENCQTDTTCSSSNSNCKARRNNHVWLVNFPPATVCNPTAYQSCRDCENSTFLNHVALELLSSQSYYRQGDMYQVVFHHSFL